MNVKGKILTVMGPRESAELGIVLPHEQPLVDLTKLLVEPPLGNEYLKHLKLEMKTLGDVRYFPYSVLDNLIVDSEEDVLSELKLYKQAGGGTLCDVSPVGVRLKRESLPRISTETGLNIVAGTSFYVEPLMPEEVKQMSVEERAQFLVDEIEHGIHGCGVRCGFIGEMGCSSPLTDNEKKSLQAAALAQKKTGAPLMIHPGPTEDAPFEILDILESSGADISHTVIAHLDRTIKEDDTLLKLAQRGCYLEFDLFGTECSHYQRIPKFDFPNDAQKIHKVKLLVDNGYVNQVLISTDIHTKHRMACYGGHGYTHIVENIIPKMKDRGISNDDVTRIITTNPQTWLTFK